MSVIYPGNATNPVLDLSLPVFADPVDLVLTNNDSGDSLTLNLPAWDGDDLTLDFVAGTITDQDDADRSALLSVTDRSLWTPEPLAVGTNAVDIEAKVFAAPASSGPRSGGTFADDASIGSQAWTDPSAAAVSDDLEATAGSLVSPTHYLKATNFGFAIPTDARVLGIAVGVERRRSGAATDYSVKLVKGGVIGSADRGDGGAIPAPDTYRTFGGASDLWGVTWTAAEINSSGFGVAYAANITSPGSAFVDHIRITAYYEVPEAPAAYGAVASWRWRRAYY